MCARKGTAVMARRTRRERIIEAFERLHDAVGAVFGAGAALRESAARAHAETMVEMWLREEGLDAARTDRGLAGVLANPRLAGVLERVVADRDAAFASWLRTGPAALAEVMATAAPGPAGSVEGWLGASAGESDSGGEGIRYDGAVPQLWRIGTARVGGYDREFPVGVPLVDESHLQVVTTTDTRAAAESLVETLLMRLVSFFPPGLVHLHVWDTGQLAGAAPNLYPLTRTGLLTVHDPRRLPQLLEQLSDRIRAVHTRVLVDGHPSLAVTPGARTEPWVVTVLSGNGQALREEDHRQLQRVARAGPACGVHLILIDVPATLNAPVETIRLRGDGAVTSSMTGPYVTATLDPPVAPAALSGACTKISAWHETHRSKVQPLHELLPPGEWWKEWTDRSASGLLTPIGFSNGKQFDMRLADLSPHALIGGPSGSGKTNLILTMIASLASRYSPDELELYLLDFKEGVSFAQFAPGRARTNYLPQARLIGVNINTDREFGLALLQFLADQMRRRAEAAKSHEVSKLEELRERDPKGRWPRIVAVIDEFQYLFGEKDAVTRAATALLEDVARRGRSQGIHLVLASQDVSGIDAFWGRQAIFEQFVLRIALPRARAVLDKANDEALSLPRWHAVINHDSGIRYGNEIVRIPDASTKGPVDEVKEKVFEHFRGRYPDPRLFDGSKAPQFAEFSHRFGPQNEVPLVFVGQCMDVDGSPATARFPNSPGRHLAVLGPGVRDATRVLGAAATSWRQHYEKAEELRVVLAALVPDATAEANDLEKHRLDGSVERVRRDELQARVTKLAAEVEGRIKGKPEHPPLPTLVVLYGADAVDTLLDREGMGALRRVLHHGPETGVHVLGWWRSVQRLKALLTVPAAADDIGCWVALDVQGGELNSLTPGLMVSWSPRPGRGLFYDRGQHARPVTVIVPALDQASEEES
jgi:hypothetical protein